MKLPSILALLLTFSLQLTAGAVDKIEDFLGLKFGAPRETAKEWMKTKGSKLKDEKNPDLLIFTEGTYAGEKMKELELHFKGDSFDQATVSIKFSTGQSNDNGLAFYETIRKALTEKYGAPTTVPSIARGKNFVDKVKTTHLETVWQFKDALRGEHRSITLLVPDLGMYEWSFKIIYQDLNASNRPATAAPGAPRKDI